MDKFIAAANRNVEQFLGDIDEQALNDAELVYEEVYTLAHEGAVNAGATMEQEQEVAQSIAAQY